MRLVKGVAPRDYETSVPCDGERHEGSRMFILAHGYADLDGEAYRAYYCDRCANRDYPVSVLQSEVVNPEATP